MRKYLIFALVALLSSCACGDDKSKVDETDDDQVLGDPAKAAFLEDFYGKYFDALGDAESLNNLMDDIVSDKGREVIKNIVGDGQNAFVDIFKPVNLDSIADRTKVKIAVNQQNNENDMLYDVVITDEEGNNSTITLSVVGDKGNYKVDSIYNPDYNK